MRKTLGLAAFAAVVSTAANLAAAVPVEPDAVPAGTEISNAFPGVTLSQEGSNFLADGIFSEILADFATTGDQVFATRTSGGAPRTSFAGRSTILLRATFDAPASSVSLDFVGAPGTSGVNAGLLRAFDAAGNQIDFATSDTITDGQVATLTVSSPLGDIASVLASGNTSTSAVVLDNLNFTPIPEPASLGLIGLAGVGLLRRRR